MVHEDGLTVAFMDLAQPSKGGHVVVVPRLHIKDIFELDDSIGAALLTATRTVAMACKRAFAAPGVTIWQQNGAPWQEIIHLHLHVLPRHPGDNLVRPWPSALPRTQRLELDRQAELIRDSLVG
jgi:histidine triad (HIT) family protein